MHRTVHALVAAIALGAAGCASSPDAPTAQASAPSCDDLRAETSRVAAEKRAAVAKEEGAWKAVVPFAVAARYATGKAAASDADRRLAELHRQSATQGCAQQ
jgi:hypothetical protein